MAIAKTTKNHIEMSWEKVRLGDVAKITKGKKHNPIFEGFNRYINIEDLHNFSNSVYTNENGVFVNIKDLIIAWDGANAGKVGIGYEGVIGSTLAKMELQNSNLHPKFLYWFLESKNEIIKSQRTGATIPHINGNSLKELLIPLPPLPTQKRIADILDTADALRRKDQELLTKYDQLAQVIFRDMFGDPVKNEKGWEVKKLGDLIAKLETGVSVNSTDEVYDDNKYCVLKTSCVYSGEFNPTQAKVIIGNEISKAKLNPQKDSIIISRMNTPELVGKSVYIPENYPNLFLPDRLWQTVKTKENHSSLWLSFALKSEMFMDQVSKICSGTSGSMKNISKKEFLDLKIIFPAFEKQKQFEILILNLKNQIKFQQNSHSTSLFSSLIQQAFNGTLVS